MDLQLTRREHEAGGVFRQKRNTHTTHQSYNSVKIVEGKAVDRKVRSIGKLRVGLSDVSVCADSLKSRRLYKMNHQIDPEEEFQHDLEDLAFKPKLTTCSLATEDDEWLDSKGVAAYLKVSIGTLRNMTSSGHILYFKLGRRNRFRVSELRELLLSQKRGVRSGN